MSGQALRAKRVREFTNTFREARLRRYRGLRRQRLQKLPIERHHVTERSST